MQGRRNERLKKMAVLLTVLLLFPRTGCSGPGRTDAVQSLRVAALAAPVTFNPLFARDMASAETIPLFFEPLLTFDPENLEPEGRLLETWEIDEGGWEYTLFLRRDASWSDGTPVTAEDVAFTIRVACHPDYTGWLYIYLKHICGADVYREDDRCQYASGGMSGLTVQDEFTLRIKLGRPHTPFLSYLAFPPLPSHLLMEVPVAELESHPFSKSPTVFSGPYLLHGKRPDAYIHARANERYYLGRPKINDIYYTVIPNPEIQLIELMAGRVDLLPHLSKPEDMPLLAADDSLAVYSTVRLAYDFIGFNLNRAGTPPADRRVRQALSMAVDRHQIVDELLPGMGRVAAGPLSPLQFAFDDTFSGYSFDPAAAKELLAAAGYGSTHLRLICNAGNLLRENIAVLFAQKAAEIGVSISVAPLEWEAFLETLYRGEFDLVLLGFGTGVDPDFSYHWHADGPGNTLGYNNGRVNNLLEEAAAIKPAALRTPLYREAQKQVVADAPAIWLYYRKAAYAATINLHNFRAHPDCLFYGVHKWELKGREGV
jgi:peptide/nickel transport system substrate-binding protein